MNRNIALILLGLTSGVLAGSPSVSYVPVTNTQVFVQNCGQWPDSILFRALQPGVTIWFTQEGLYYQYGLKVDSATSRQALLAENLIHEKFMSTNAFVEVIGEGETSYRCHYYLTNDTDNWITDIPSFAAIRYRGLLPGVDLRYYFHDGRLEYDYLVSSSVNAMAINIQYEGIDSLFKNMSGDLVASTDWGRITHHSPVIYDAGSRDRLCGNFRIDSRSSSFGFDVPTEVEQMAIVIDPYLTFSSYLGGSHNEYGWDIDVDDRGYIYTVGYTQSADFPNLNLPGPPLGWDMFVTKLSPMGREILWTAVIGGGDSDGANSCKVDPFGNLVVGGFCASWDFPLYRPIDSVFEGQYEAVLLKLGKDGNQLLFSTFLGGDERDSISDVTLDRDGNIYACGTTSSDNYPVKNPFRDSATEAVMAFVTKVPPFGDSLIYSTYLGGGWDYVTAAVDESNHAIIAGRTWDKHFPLKNPIDSTRGSSGAFVAKLVPEGNDIEWSTFLSGDNSSAFTAVELDEQGRIFLTGRASVALEGISYPLVNPIDYVTYYEGGIATILDPTGQSILFSTFWDGFESSTDEFRDIALDSAGNMTMVGCINGTFRLVNHIDSGYQGYEAQVSLVKFSPNGSGVVYSTLLGGPGSDGGWALDVDNQGNAYVIGTNGLGEWPLVRPVDSIYEGWWDLPSDCILAIVSDNATDASEYPPNNLPSSLVLHQNYPNPFNSETTIKFELVHATYVDLAIYNVLGERVRTIAAGKFPAGSHKLTWDAKDESGGEVASGVYIFRLAVSEQSFSKKLLLLK